MKTINNIKTDLKLNRWLYEKKDDKTIMIKTRRGDYTTLSGYKIELNENLKDKECEETDVMEIWDISNLSDTKLLWQRGELLSKEEFMKEYEKVFDNNVDWEDAAIDKLFIKYDHFNERPSIYLAYRFEFAGVRCTIDREKAQDFIKEYEQEIKKYLFGLEVE